MPFTISHAAAALPVHALSRRLPLAALMIGAMAPDFTYFLFIERDVLDGHSLAGLFEFSLPAGLVVWLYFVTLLERPTLAYLPDTWRMRITTSDLSPGGIVLATLAVLLGAITHIVWDALTHSSQPLLQNIPGIHDSYVDALGPRIPLHFVLQVMSSVLGLLALAFWALNIRKRAPAPDTEVAPPLVPPVNDFERIRAVILIVVSSFGVALIGAAFYGDVSISYLVFSLLVGGMAGAFVGWSFLALTARYRLQSVRRAERVAPK